MPVLWSGSTNPAVVGSIAKPSPEARDQSRLILGISPNGRTGRLAERRSANEGYVARMRRHTPSSAPVPPAAHP